MFVIMGGTGHVGSATAAALRARGQKVTIITHDQAIEAEALQDAERVVADANDVNSLRSAFQRGRRALLLNPPGNPTADAEALEKQSEQHILAALKNSGLEKIVAASTYGAQPGDQIADLGTLWMLEEGLRKQPIPAAINRAAYYMTNWDGSLPTVRDTGMLSTPFPTDFEIPMVAPQDLGEAAADRLMSDVNDAGVRHVEGPERYSAVDVAAAFAQALGRPVEACATPRSQWQAMFEKLGFSNSSARSFARMTGITVDSPALPDTPYRGRVTLQAYIRALVDPN